MKKNPSKAIVKLVVSFGIGILLVYLSVNGLSPEDIETIKKSFQSANLFWLLLPVFAAISSHMSRAYRWRMMLIPLGYKPGYWNTFFAVMAMYIGNLAFPRLGEGLRCAILNRYEKVPIDKAVGTMVTERAIDVLCLLAVGALTFLFARQKFLDLFNSMLSEQISSILSDFRFLALLAVICLSLLLLFLFLLKRRILPFSEVILKIINGIYQGVISVVKMKNKWSFLGHTVFIWSMYWAMVYLSFNALNETIHLTAGAGLSCLFFGSFGIIATPGGLGSYPLIVREVLSLYEIVKPIGFAFGTMVWSIQTIMIIILGTISIILLPILNKKKEIETP